MAINFPISASLNDTYTYNSKTWKWNGTAWEKSSATETGNTEGNTGEIAYYDTVGSVIKGATAFKYDDSTGVVHFYQGISADKGATFGGAVNFTDSIYMAGALRHIGDTNTKIVFEPGIVKMRASDNIFIKGTSTQVQFPLGISADAGATFGTDVNILGGLEVGGYWAGQHEEVIGISVNNGSSVLTTGTKGHRTIPYACDIVDWRVTSTDSGSIVWGLNYSTYANFPTMTAFVFDTQAETPKISSAYKNTTSGGIADDWNPYQIAAGTVIEFEIHSVTTLTNCILELTIRRTS